VRIHSPLSSPTSIDDQPLSRDDKRYTEKKNKTERARRKKEDTARLRSIVDVCLSIDPRIKRIKQEEKEAREAKRRGKAGTPQNQKAKEEEEKKKAEEEAKKKEEEEKVRGSCFIDLNKYPTTLQVAREQAKKDKVAAANAAKKARRAARAAAD